MLKWWGPEGATVGGARVGHQGRRQLADRIGQAGRRPLRLLRRLQGASTGRAASPSPGPGLQPDGSRGHETVVDVAFEKVERGTRMTLVQKTFQDAEQRALHNQGWTSTLNKLERMFA